MRFLFVLDSVRHNVNQLTFPVIEVKRAYKVKISPNYAPTINSSTNIEAAKSRITIFKIEILTLNVWKWTIHLIMTTIQVATVATGKTGHFINFCNYSDYNCNYN